MTLARIISGGQTGADRGALDAAIALGLPHGGACPRGRLAEDGRIPDRYTLREMPTPAYALRTEANVAASDGTVIISRGPLTGGSALTRTLCARHDKPCLHLDLATLAEADAAARLRTWIADERLRTLNVAGPRESGCPGIASAVEAVLALTLGPSGAGRPQE